MVGQTVVELARARGRTATGPTPNRWSSRTCARCPGTPILREALRDGGPVSAASVVIHSGGRPFGTLCALSAEPRAFSPQDVTFLQTVADLLSTLIESKRQEAVSREVEARYQRIVANIPGMVYQYGLARRTARVSLPFISEGCRQIYEVEPADPAGRPGAPARRASTPRTAPTYDAAVRAVRRHAAAL